ncbi:hypothetical protein [Curvibacter fontanus]
MNRTCHQGHEHVRSPAWRGTGRFLALSLASLTLLLASVAHAQPYVNVTVGGEFVPGVFGQVSVGSNPPPPVFNPQPVIVGTPIYGTQPIYVHVPDEDREDWERSCRRYNACGRPVYFIRADERDRWWERRGKHRHHDDDDDDDDDEHRGEKRGRHGHKD